MSSLAKTYANTIGVKLGKPYTNKKFYPLEFEKYITIQPFSSNQPSKNYDYWTEVVSIIGPILESNGIKIIQLGGKDEQPLVGCHHLIGKTSIAQSNYIIGNAILHIGADSLCQHVAGALHRPLVVPFGSTSAENHGAEWKDRYIFIESHRFGRKTSFGHEHEKTINVIPPEDLVNSVLKILGANITLNRKSLLIGAKYTQNVLEWVPDTHLSPDFAKGAPVVARCDLGGDENTLFQTLSARKLHILTRAPLNIQGIAQLKGNIEQLVIEFCKETQVTIDFIKQIKSLGVKLVCFTTDLDGDELAQVRLKFFDYCQIIKANHKTRENFISDSRRYLNDPNFNFTVGPSTWFRSNRFILARGKIYLSKFHYLANLPTEDFSKNVSQVIDHEEFWREQDYFYCFEQAVQT